MHHFSELQLDIVETQIKFDVAYGYAGVGQ